MPIKHATQIVGSNNPSSQVSANVWNSAHDATFPYILVGSGSGCDYITDGTADDVQLNAALTAIRLTGGVINLSNNLSCTDTPLLYGSGSDGGFDWESQPFISIEGNGHSILQNTSGKNAFKVNNNAYFALRNTRLISSDVEALYLANDGGDSELSCTNSVIDNVLAFGADATHYAAKIQNFFNINVPVIHARSETGHGILIENDSPTINYGNSHFGFINAKGAVGKICCNIAGTSHLMNLLSIDHIQAGRGNAGVGVQFTDSAGHIVINFIHGEECDIGINVTGSSGKVTRNIRVLHSFITSVNSGDIGINLNAYTAGCVFNGYVDCPSGKHLANDGGHYGEGNRAHEFNLEHSTDIAAANYTFRSGAKGRVRLQANATRIPDYGVTSVADGGTITHICGLTPNLIKLTPTVSGEMVSATAVGATTVTVAIKKHDNTAGTTQNIYWEFGYQE